MNETRVFIGEDKGFGLPLIVLTASELLVYQGRECLLRQTVGPTLIESMIKQYEQSADYMDATASTTDEQVEMIVEDVYAA